jgi:hypothetical protein
VAYDPEDDAIVDLGIPARGDWHRYHHVGSQVVALAVDGGGRIYGSIEFKYADSDLFVYDPGIGQLTNLGVAVPKQISALVACGDDNTIYAGIGLNNSYYIGPAYLFAFRDDCPSGSIGAWGHVTWEAETPPGTRIVVDVLRDVKSGDPLWGIDPAEHLAIRLRATLFTSDERVTPVLKNWRVDYTFECQQ